jgi:transposase
MAKPLVDDELWAVVAPLLPAPKPRRYRYPGRKPISDRAALTGIIFVLQTGIPWAGLPVEMGCGSGMTCWRRLRDWQAAGVWQAMHQAMLDHLACGWPFGPVSGDCRQRLGSRRAWRGPNRPEYPTDRAKPGSKHPVLTDANGWPLNAQVTAANVNDVTQLEPLLAGMAPIRGRPGRPRRKPHQMQGDRGYDSQPLRDRLRAQGIVPVLARRGTAHGSGLGRTRWVVERTIAWFHQFRRLRNRYERRADIHQAFLHRASALICWRGLEST